MNKEVLFAIIGAILGIPLSYYFQSEMVKILGFVDYIQHFDQIANNSNLLGNFVLSVVIFAITGGVIGYFRDENVDKILNENEPNSNTEEFLSKNNISKVLEELGDLGELLKSGAINQEEFEKLKSELLDFKNNPGTKKEATPKT